MQGYLTCHREEGRARSGRRDDAISGGKSTVCHRHYPADEAAGHTRRANGRLLRQGGSTAYAPRNDLRRLLCFTPTSGQDGWRLTFSATMLPSQERRLAAPSSAPRSMTTERPTSPKGADTKTPDSN